MLNTIFINASPENMMWLQYLIELGLRGNHPLFEPEDIRKAFDRDMGDLTNIGPDAVKEVNTVIKGILQAPDVETQRDLIRELNPNIRDILVHLYFQMIDQNLFGSNPTRH